MKLDGFENIVDKNWGYHYQICLILHTLPFVIPVMLQYELD